MTFSYKKRFILNKILPESLTNKVYLTFTDKNYFHDINYNLEQLFFLTFPNNDFPLTFPDRK